MSPIHALTRDPNNKVIAGVCSGIANYFGWDPTVVRAVFAISLLFGGSGFFVYLVLWLVMPEGPAIQPVEEFVFEEQVYPAPTNFGQPYPQPYSQPGDAYNQAYPQPDNTSGQAYPQPGDAYNQPNN